MTRFEQEVKGCLGEFWKKDALKRVKEVCNDYNEGKITVDENGVARNCIGRIIMDDMAEVLEYADCCEWFSREATRVARSEDNAKTIEAYKQNRKNKEYSEEEIFEMRAAFGAGTKVVDILTGKKITL